ncbi:MAG: hypothetical protein IH868_03570 [Chloroflexi bacterium]|nr:hypothetical protein [Chloroflexota bacterium]
MVNRGDNYSGNTETDKQSVQSLWREAMVLRDLARDGITESRERRAQAEAARKAAEQEALKATEEFCQGLRAQAEADLEKASNTLADTDRLKKEFETDLQKRGRQAEADIQSRQDKVDAELARAAIIRKEADDHELARRKEADKIIAEALDLAEQSADEAREHAGSLIAGAQLDADDIRDEMRAQTAGEIRSLVADVEAARSAVLEELETQRILTEAARIKATSPEAAAKAADIAAGRQPIGHEDSVLLERVRSFQDQTAEAQPDAEPELILLETQEPSRAKAPKKAAKPSKRRSIAKAEKKAA